MPTSGTRFRAGRSGRRRSRPSTLDEVSSTYGAFPLLFGLVAIVTFVLLARGLKSILLPAKAVLLNALSVAATYGIVVLVFQHGIGAQALWGMSATGSIGTFVPILIFGFLFGISMDYEVFILSRVREGYERTGSTHDGLVEGLSHTGRLVTSAALILFFALASLSSGNDPTVRELAAGLAAGVLLDAVVVRMLLLPALVSLFRRAQLVAAAAGRSGCCALPRPADQASPVGSGARAQGR